MINVHLPKTIRVRIKKLPKKKLFAELTDYGVFTEADNEKELLYLINDLVYTYFNIPKVLQMEFFYKPKEDKDFEKAKPFVIFSTPEFSKKYLNS